MFKGKICISRIDKMGDMILTLPVIKSIKVQNPNSEIHVIASTHNVKVLKNINYIDKVLLIKSNTYLLSQPNPRALDNFNTPGDFTAQNMELNHE